MANTGQAGPWPREKGKTFLSFGSTYSLPRDAFNQDPEFILEDLQTFYSLYMERGFGNDLTFGLDAGSMDFLDYSVIAFLRMPVLNTGGAHRFAVQFGVGSHGDLLRQDTLVQLGASWGRGLDTPFGSGWAVADAQAVYDVESGETITKLDVTLGVKPKDRLKLMMQVQAGRYPGSEPYMRLAPSFAWEIKPKRHIEVGIQIGVVGDDRIAFKTGTWMEF